MKLPMLRTSAKENFKSDAKVYGSSREYKRACNKQRKEKLQALVKKFS